LRAAKPPAIPHTSQFIEMMPSGVVYGHGVR
jgi:hypothetical protein